MNDINLHDKEHAIERLEYVKGLNYTDKEYKKNLRKHKNHQGHHLLY